MDQSEERGKRQLAATFDALAATYDQLWFLQISAARLVELAEIREGARVLDVGTGTGVAAVDAARRVGPRGTVIGVDLSPVMLAQARQKAAASGLSNLEFREGDAEDLEFADTTFDVTLCASSLFFIPNMATVVAEWRRVLVPGGTAAFAVFGPTFLQPLRDLWEARLRAWGLAAAALPTHRLNDAGQCEKLLRDAGFDHVDVRVQQLGYYLPSPLERWADIVAGIEGKPLLQLHPGQRAQVQAEHLAELQKLVGDKGLRVDVPAIFALGR